MIPCAAVQVATTSQLPPVRPDNCQCPAHRHGIDNAAAMLAATGVAPIVLNDGVACYSDLGKHIARTFEGPGRITMLWCERLLMAFEGLREPLSAGQWRLLADGIEAELAKMAADEKRDAWLDDREEDEIAVVVREYEADAAVAAE